MFERRSFADIAIKQYLKGQTADPSEWGSFTKLIFLMNMKNVERCFIMRSVGPHLNEYMNIANEYLNEYSRYLRIYRGYPEFDAAQLRYQKIYGPVKNIELEQEVSNILHMFVRGCDLSKSGLDEVIYDFNKLRDEIKLYRIIRLD